MGFCVVNTEVFENGVFWRDEMGGGFLQSSISAHLFSILRPHVSFKPNAQAFAILLMGRIAGVLQRFALYDECKGWQSRMLFEDCRSSCTIRCLQPLWRWWITEEDISEEGTYLFSNESNVFQVVEIELKYNLQTKKDKCNQQDKQLNVVGAAIALLDILNYYPL